ncbi:MAG TPA: CDP-diacylglycerol--glycerol-3-phosphate 3-phosphatidyltransferase [Treponema sp.]|nr:CDP-diacylglycerol--glycerol-3-phosphate 3-phosphatidyltransferase [Treponema sp.]
MKSANVFTSIRIVLAPVFFILFFLPEYLGFGAQVSVFLLIPLFLFMEYTDYLDGFFARKYCQVSDFGKLFDPFADVLANMTVLLVFVLSGYLPAILFLIILYREMGIMFLRMLAIKKGVVIAARKGGKLKTVLYIVSAGFSLLIESLSRLGISTGSASPVLTWINLSLYFLAVLVSVLSFLDYLRYFSSIKGITE